MYQRTFLDGSVMSYHPLSGEMNGNGRGFNHSIEPHVGSGGWIRKAYDVSNRISSSATNHRSEYSCFLLEGPYYVHVPVLHILSTSLMNAAEMRLFLGLGTSSAF